MDSPVIVPSLVTALVLLVIKEIWNTFKTKNTKVEEKLDKLSQDFSEIKTMLLLSQTKYDLMHQQQKEDLNNYFERLRAVEQRRPSQPTAL